MASEDYLESIYRIMVGQDAFEKGIRSVDVAEQLEVSKASVNKALSMLKDEGMVNQEHYGKVTLTDEGRAYARLVWRAHRALRAFLIDEIGVDEETADEEACLMEHALSAKTMDLLVGHLKEKGIFIEE
jgi:Mn-dependent DtxR family transcriptional regulator